MNMSITGLIITIGIIVLGIFDLCMVVFHGTGSSISDFLIKAGFKSPVMVFAFGFVSGHLFANMWPSKEYAEKILKDGKP